jgi:hypothetical protein
MHLFFILLTCLVVHLQSPLGVVAVTGHGISQVIHCAHLFQREKWWYIHAVEG